MGGSVVVKSQVGRGTDFIINLKVKTKPSKVALVDPRAYEDYLVEIDSVAAEPETTQFLKLIEADKVSFETKIRLDNQIPIPIGRG